MNKLFQSVGRTELLSHTVEQAIEAAIREGHLSVGDKLPSEFELCSQFDVSRTVIREALRMLAARGLVRIEKGRGVFVCAPSVESVSNPMALYLHMHVGPNHALEVVRARQLIEPVIAAEAARRHTQEDVQLIMENLEMLKTCTDSFEKLTQVDMDFHMLIAKATHNPVIPLIIHPIQQLMPRIKLKVYLSVEDAHASAVKWHTAIAEAIFARNAEQALECMTQHLKIAEEHVRKMLAMMEREVQPAGNGQTEQQA
ncbi:FadR/GntR family transcriptional regulator [Rhodothermus profundi]|uniref:Transcriptional regulator, GntR family n=1 Tax=Rhodothermus profundi TaxID=633813 RepID=A0A1M6T097_9BACT|nr:FadR/GntR family transcriptional regulator [Rhodothermus profundi]SHK50391.1 transcriptional regulator, GntR family [Rhodothermus profundi]